MAWPLWPLEEEPDSNLGQGARSVAAQAADSEAAAAVEESEDVEFQWASFQKDAWKGKCDVL